MRITLVCGSHRENSQSLKVAKFLSSALIKNGAETSILDLGTHPLPLWDSSMWEKKSELKDRWNEFNQDLSKSDAYIFVTPEYAGMASPAIKNFFLYLSGADISHKPGLIVTVSSGMGGSYPNAELRMSSYKNTRIVYIPDHVIVRHVESMLNSEEPSSKEDEYIRNRLIYVAKVLMEYSKAFVSIRSSGVIDIKTYPFGL